jgi:hypothetical protein
VTTSLPGCCYRTRGLRPPRQGGRLDRLRLWSGAASAGCAYPTRGCHRSVCHRISWSLRLAGIPITSSSSLRFSSHSRPRVVNGVYPLE